MKLKQTNIFLIIVKELLKSKILFIAIFGILFWSCKAQEVNSKDLKKIEPTHIINNEKIIKILEDLEQKKELFSNKSDCIYLDFKKYQSDDFLILATQLSFLDYKILSYNNKKKLKGYFHYDGKIVLLYGYLDKSLFIANGLKVKNITKSSYKVDKDHPPISLHLNFIKFHLKNNQLTQE